MKEYSGFPHVVASLNLVLILVGLINYLQVFVPFLGRIMFCLHTGPPLDQHAVRVETEKLRHEIVADPRCQRLQSHKPYTKTELYKLCPPVLDHPPSSALGRPRPLTKVKKRRFRRRESIAIPECDSTITLIILSIIPCFIAIVVEGIAYSHDATWNVMVEDENPFPPIPISAEDFDDKTLITDKEERYAEMRRLSVRDGYLETVALCLVAFSFSLIAIVLVMYTAGEAYKRTVVFCHVPVGLMILLASICIFVGSDQIDKDHLKSAEEMELFFQHLMDYKNKGPSLHLDEIGVQTMNVIAIQKICALRESYDGGLVSSPSTNYMYVLLDKPEMDNITLDDLRTLHFCSFGNYKQAAGYLLLLYFILCYVIQLAYLWHERGLLTKVDHGDSTEIESTDAEMDNGIPRLPASPPPAYGYGYRQEGDTAGEGLRGSKYDSRYAPNPSSIASEELL